MHASAEKAPISVLTVTRRPTTILRCVASVEAQGYGGPVEHVFIIDGSRETHAILNGHRSRFARQLHYVPRAPQDEDGPARLSRLRNLAVDAAKHELIAFIDDDNEWETDHLASLVRSGEAGKAFAHSERRLFHADGRPYCTPEFPWRRDVLARRQSYARYAALGVVADGDNVFRDRMDLPETCIDLGEWLFPRAFIQAVRFEERYDLDDWQNILVEDGKLARAIAASGARVVSTCQPTLRYYLGGYSNNFSPRAPIYWRRPREADA